MRHSTTTCPEIDRWSLQFRVLSHPTYSRAGKSKLVAFKLSAGMDELDHELQSTAKEPPMMSASCRVCIFSKCVIVSKTHQHQRFQTLFSPKHLWLLLLFWGRAFYLSFNRFWSVCLQLELFEHAFLERVQVTLLWFWQEMRARSQSEFVWRWMLDSNPLLSTWLFNWIGTPSSARAVCVIVINFCWRCRKSLFVKVARAARVVFLDVASVL